MDARGHADDLREQVGALLRNPAADRLAAAIATLGEDALETWPAIALRAELLRRRGRHDEAAPLFAAAIDQAPDLLPAYHCAALNAVARGDREGARARWAALLERSPDDALARYQIGLTYHEARDFAAAALWYERQLAHDPQSFKAAWNLGLAQSEQRDAEGAAAAFLRAHALAPTDPRPLAHAADALGDAAELPAAIDALDRAIALAPQDASLRWRAAAHLGNLGVHDRALARMREALALDPSNAHGHSALLMQLQYDTTLATRAELARMHWDWGERHTRGVRRQTIARQPRAPNVPLRVGYVSPRFGHGPLASFFLPVVEAHDVSRFHVTLYSTYPHEDAVTARLRSAAAAWRDLPADDDAAAAMIAADGLDLLVDLAGHAPGHRLGVFARKPAGVQASWLDAFETTGVAAIDYFVSDATHAPAAETAHFRERLVWLPYCRFCYRSVVPAVSSPPPSQVNGFATFGSFNRHAKITMEALALWRTVLDAVPGSRLQLRASAYRGPGTVDWVRQHWAAAGMPMDRIDFRPYVPLTEAIGAYRAIDVALDTFPYNGGVTTCDALSMGIPVIALEGDRMIARQSAALLRAAGHAEWIAGDAGEYVAIAARVADEVRRSGLRAELADAFPRSRLCDVPAFVAALERTWLALVALGPRDDGPPEPPLEITG